MSRTLRIARDLILPLEAVTQTFLVVGKRGSGKTSTAVRLAEQFYRAKVPFAVVDPVDVWWGLKSSRKGGPGLGVYVFGGRHGDLPLEPAAGALIADVLVDHRISVVLSVKHFSGRERDRFVGELAARLFQRNTEPLHLFLEEAHEVAPQHPFKGEEQMLHHVRRIWKLGRASGLGGCAVTQRPASLDKNITTQAEILIVHRTIGPQDVAAIREWIRYHGEREDILAQLGTLKTGEAFVWAPDFPEGKPIGLQRVKVLPRETFDSSATPKAGERRIEPKALAPVDLERLRKRMASTIEKAKAEDPRELRNRIRSLEQQLAQALKVATVPLPKRARAIEIKKIPALKKGEIRRVEAIVKGLAAIADRLKITGVAWSHEGERLVQALRGAQEVSAEALRPQERVALPAPRPVPLPARATGYPTLREAPRKPVGQPGASWDGQRLPPGEKATLTAAAQRPEGVYRDQLSVLTGYKRSSRDAYIQRLREKGLVAVEADRILPTREGIEALGDGFQPLPMGDELRDYWMGRLPPGEKTVLEALIKAYPNAVNRDSLSEETTYARSSRDAYLQRLKARRLVDLVGRGKVRASGMLFG